MNNLVYYKEVPLGDKIGWKVEYEPVWGGEGKVMGWKPKVVLADVGDNYKIKIDEAGYVYIDDNRYNPFEGLKPLEKHGLYDLYIDNHIDIPDSISKDSPCYKQFMKEKEVFE